MDHFRLEGLRRAVREHLTEYGARNWKLVTDRFADVPRATFWRTVKTVREEGEALSKNKKPSSEDPAPASSTMRRQGVADQPRLDMAPFVTRS